MNDWDASELAWELAGAISSRLADPDRAQIYGTIGSGDSYTAIGLLLETVAQERVSLPAELIAKLADWFDAYVHSADAPRLQGLLGAIRSSPAG